MCRQAHRIPCVAHCRLRCCAPAVASCNYPAILISVCSTRYILLLACVDRSHDGVLENACRRVQPSTWRVRGAASSGPNRTSQRGVGVICSMGMSLISVGHVLVCGIVLCSDLAPLLAFTVHRSCNFMWRAFLFWGARPSRREARNQAIGGVFHRCGNRLALASQSDAQQICCCLRSRRCFCSVRSHGQAIRPLGIVLP